MNPLSKNAPLKESIKNMQAVLDDTGFKTEFSYEKNPLESCYSVNLTSVEAPQHIYSNGKGIESDACVASALGEYIERLQTNNFFIDFNLANRKQYPDEVAFEFGGEYLSDELSKIYNPTDELSDEDLVDFNSDYEDKIVCLPFTKQSSGEKIYIPINILSNLYVSNGLASGNTPLEAKSQALSEIFERYAKIEIIKNGYALPKFPDSIVESFEKLHKDVTKLRELGFIIEVLDASLGGRFPTTAISLINPRDSTLFVSFGAHPILELSLERTMTELMQGRSLDDLNSFETPTFDMSIVADSFNLESHFVDSNAKLGFDFLSSLKSFEYCEFTYDGKNSEDEYKFLLDILKTMQKEVYLREYNYLGFYSCQIIVPSISEVYPIEDLIYNNKNSGKLIRDMVLNYQDYKSKDILQAIESLENSLNMQKFIGVIFENNFNMSEFKAHILLILGDYEEALELLEYGDNKLGHIIVELSRMQDLGKKFEQYEDGLYHIFTKEMVTKAVHILNGSETFLDMTLHIDYINILAMYDKLSIKKSV